MAKQEKRNSQNDIKRVKPDDIDDEVEQRRLEKWRLGRRNFS